MILTPYSNICNDALHFSFLDRLFRHGASNRNAANYKKQVTDNGLDPAAILSIGGVLSTSSIKEQDVLNTFRNGRSAGSLDLFSSLEASDSSTYAASPAVKCIKSRAMLIPEDNPDIGPVNSNRTRTAQDNPRVNRAPNCSVKELKQSDSDRNFSSFCQICNARVPEHIYENIYYEKILSTSTCFSCRDFFRKSIAKAHQFVCVGNKQCPIKVTSPKYCHYCRYQACLNAGMKPTWILTEREKRKQMKRQKRSEYHENFWRRQKCP